MDFKNKTTARLFKPAVLLIVLIVGIYLGMVFKQRDLVGLWKEYINYEFGFSIWYPKTVAAAQGMDTYGKFINTQIIEDTKNNRVYIGVDYNPSRRPAIEEALGRKATIRELFGGPVWMMTFRFVNNESELKSFIADQYGSDCKISARVSYIGNPGIEKITLENPDPNRGGMGQNPAIDCDFGPSYEILYNRSGKKVMAIDMTNEPVFHADISRGIVYDQVVLDSLIFD